jgi:tRNA-dihydrouridine synthase B
MGSMHKNDICTEPAGTSCSPAQLPWPDGVKPLMLAPMQGLTNRAMRSLFATWVRPDLVYTEFMRVGNQGSRPLAASDLREIGAREEGVPLVVQLVGHGQEALVAAARAAQTAGARHLDLNLGCPYGRMTSGLTGGGMLRSPELVAGILPALRRVISGTFSVKLRAGYDDPRQIMNLLPMLEDAGVDFIVLHPRTVVQGYDGKADHRVTAQVVHRTRLPVIANGDIRTAADGWRVLEETGAAGLMLGRGAMADPLLFARLRGEAPATPDLGEYAEMLRRYLLELLARYGELFCGEAQVLGKVKAVLACMDDPGLARALKQLRKARTVQNFAILLDELA